MSTNTALVPLDEDAGLGPAMRALPTEKMRAFVRHLVATGSSASDAARAAGYKADIPSSLHASASLLTHDPRIQAAILEEGIKQVRADGPMALKVLRDIASDKNNAPRDRIKAAEAILNRGGFSSVTRTDITVTHQTEGEKDREIIALANELGLDAAAQAKLLGRPIDVEFKEIIVDPPTDIAPPRSSAGRKIKNPDGAEWRADKRKRYRETEEEKLARQAHTSAERKRRAKEKFEAAQAARRAQEPELFDDDLDELIRS